MSVNVPFLLRPSLWSFPPATGKGSRSLRRAGRGGCRGWGEGQGAGAAAAAGANRGDRDAGGTGTGTPLSKSSFPLRDPAGASEKPGVGAGVGAPEAGGRSARRVQEAGWPPGDCGPGGWVGRGCPGSSVESVGCNGPGGPSQERSLHPPPPALREISELSQEAGAPGRWVRVLFDRRETESPAQEPQGQQA